MDGKQISKWSKDSLKTRKVKSCVPGTFQKGEESLKTSGRSLRSVQRRKDILDSALHVIYREGIQNLTTRKAAEGAGITEGALYRHFSGKGAMLRCLVERLEEGFRIERDDLTGWAGIEAFIRVRTERVLREPELARILFSEFMFTSEPACEEIMFRLMHQNLEVLAVYFEQAQKAGELRDDIPVKTLFRLVLGPIRLVIQQWGLTEGGFPLEEEVEIIIQTLRRTLKPEIKK
ncbi:MAG: TetR/AcrR family transcriptional regulator [Planctomycetaceae bacterium]|nr:TetR/AcrR family transcriptional regulator [Planctomycetaceae bacterium]